VQFVELKVPGPVVENVTLPVGVTGAPESVSVTIALHVEGWLITTGVAHDVEVEVDLGVTVIELEGLWLLE